MTKVKTTGVYFAGICDLALGNCLAREPSPITAVMTVPHGRQINVCRNCLQEMIDNQEWLLEGAGFRAKLDYALVDDNGEPSIVLEVKRRPASGVEESRWAASYFRNLVAHGYLKPGVVVMLAVVGGNLYGWRVTRLVDQFPSPIVQVDLDRALSDVGLPPIDKSLAEEFAVANLAPFLERLVSHAGGAASWIRDIRSASIPIRHGVIRSSFAYAAG